MEELKRKLGKASAEEAQKRIAVLDALRDELIEAHEEIDQARSLPIRRSQRSHAHARL
jgi:hypothetical protein